MFCVYKSIRGFGVIELFELLYLKYIAIPITCLGSMLVYLIGPIPAARLYTRFVRSFADRSV